MTYKINLDFAHAKFLDSSPFLKLVITVMSRTKNKFDDVPGTAFFQGYTNNSIGKSTFIAEKAKREMEVY